MDGRTNCGPSSEASLTTSSLPMLICPNGPVVPTPPTCGTMMSSPRPNFLWDIASRQRVSGPVQCPFPGFLTELDPLTVAYAESLCGDWIM
jgi:hypothetical protein